MGSTTMSSSPGSSSQLKPLKIVFIKCEDGHLNLPKTWKDLTTKCMQYKDVAVYLFANVGQSGVSEAQAHARALVVAGQPHVALTDSQYTQAYGAPVPAGDPPYVPLTGGCERTNLSFYDQVMIRLFSDSKLPDIIPAGGGAAPSRQRARMKAIIYDKVNRLNTMFCQPLCDAVKADKRLHTILSGSADAAVRIRNWQIDSCIPDDCIDAAGNFLPHRLPWVALWMAVASNSGSVSSVSTGSALTALLGGGRTNDVSLQALEERWRDNITVVTNAFPGAAACLDSFMATSVMLKIKDVSETSTVDAVKLLHQETYEEMREESLRDPMPLSWVRIEPMYQKYNNKLQSRALKMDLSATSLALTKQGGAADDNDKENSFTSLFQKEFAKNEKRLVSQFDANVNKKFVGAGLPVPKAEKSRRTGKKTAKKRLCHYCQSDKHLAVACDQKPVGAKSLNVGFEINDGSIAGDHYSLCPSPSPLDITMIQSKCLIHVPRPPACSEGGVTEGDVTEGGVTPTRSRRGVTEGGVTEGGAKDSIIVCDTGNDRAASNNAAHILRKTGQDVFLTGAHGGALKMEGVMLGFPTRDSRGRATMIVCRDTGAYSPDLLHVLLPVARLMKTGFEFFFRLPSDAFNDGFDEYVNGGYGGYIKCPDGAVVVMRFNDKTNIWSLPPPIPDLHDLEHGSFSTLATSSTQEAENINAMGSFVFTQYDPVADVLLPASHRATSLPGMWTCQPCDENGLAYQQDQYRQQAMDYHRMFGHPSAPILIQSLQKLGLPYKHLVPYINKLECQACLMMHGHRE